MVLPIVLDAPEKSEEGEYERRRKGILYAVTNLKRALA